MIPEIGGVKMVRVIGVLVTMAVLAACSSPAPVGVDPGTGGPSVTDTTVVSDEVPDPEGILTTVSAIVDGDTMDVAPGEERVRLIGIDTPEVHGEVECYGDEASEHLATLIPVGTEVRIELDVEERDRYGRLLAYVWRAADGLFINEAMVGDGYAMVYTFPPNVRYVEVFVAAQREAREADRGLWGTCPPEGSATTAGSGIDAAVTITTIEYDACGNDVECYNDSEYVELASSAGDVVELSGWSLVDLKDHRIVVPSGFTIRGEGTFRIYSGAGDNDPLARYFAGLPQAIWNNSGGDTAFLYDAAGRLVAEYSYSS